MRLRYVYKMPQSSCIQKNQFTYIWQHTSTYPQLSHNCTTRCQRCVARWTHSRTANSINRQVNMMYANCEAWCYNKHWIMITLSTSWIHDTTHSFISGHGREVAPFSSRPRSPSSTIEHINMHWLSIIPIAKTALLDVLMNNWLSSFLGFYGIFSKHTVVER